MARWLNVFLKEENFYRFKQFFSAHPFFRWRRKNGGCSLPNTSDVPGLDVLGEVSTALTAVCENAEPRFLEIGEKLQTFYLEAAELAQHTMESDKTLGGGADESVLVKVKDVSRRALNELSEQQAGVAADLTNANTMVEKLDALFAVRAALERISKSLGIVGMNIGIEGAKSEQSQEKFSGFSGDIRKLSEKISGMGQAVHEDVKTAMTTQKSTCHEIASGLTRLEGLAGDAGVAVDGAVVQVEEITGILFEAMENTRENSSEISRRVGDVVMGIQFHDNMRQRVEHIVHALGDLRTFSKEGNAEDPPERTGSSNSAEAFSILKLQAAQLSGIISEIKNIYHGFVEAFDEIRVHVDGLGAGLSSLNASEVDGIVKCEEAVEAPIDYLKTTLKALDGLLEDGRGLMEGMRGAAVQASKVAVKVGSHTNAVKEISIETHMMALNAVIKSAHLGDEGRVFEILAQEVKRLSDMSMRFAADAEHTLGLINDSARALRDASSGRSGNREDEGGTKGLLKAGFKEIVSDYARFTENYLEAQQRSKGLKKDISAVVNGLSFLPDLSNDLKRQLDVMEAVIAALEPLAVEKQKSLTQSEIDDLSRRYTMAEEREIHKEMVASAAGTQAPVEDVLFFDDDGETFPAMMEQDEEASVELENVELFDAATGESGEEVPDVDFGESIELFGDHGPAGEDASNHDVVLFEDFSADSGETSQTQVDRVDEHIPDAHVIDARKREIEAEDLGDNVELF